MTLKLLERTGGQTRVDPRKLNERTQCVFNKQLGFIRLRLLGWISQKVETSPTSYYMNLGLVFNNSLRVLGLILS